MRMDEVPATYVAFDLLWLDGEPVHQAAATRSGASCSPGSASTGRPGGRPRTHFGDGERFLEAIRAAGPGGHRRQAARSARTGPGRRSGEWLKLRNRPGQELVIGGWMPGEGSRGGRVGSLLLGYLRRGQARLRRRRRHRLHPGSAGRDHRAAEAARPPDEPVRARRGPRGQVPRPLARDRGGPVLGRAGARLRGRVHRVDPRGDPAPALVQGPAHRQTRDGGRSRGGLIRYG